MIIDSPIISGSLASTGSLTQIGNVVITGSLSVSGPIKGNITGSADSASFATTSSYAVSASFATTAVTSSYPFTLSGSVLYTTTGVPYLSKNYNRPTISIGKNIGSGSFLLYSDPGYNVYIGHEVATFTTESSDTVAIGTQAASQLVGGYAFATMVGSYTGFEGYELGESVLIGYSAGNNLLDGYQVTVVGEDAAYGGRKLDRATLIGNSAGAGTNTGSFSTAVGYNAFSYADKSIGSVFLGAWAGNDLISGSNSIIIGPYSGRNVTLKRNNIIIGTNVSLPTNAQDSINIGGLIFGTGSAWVGVDPTYDDYNANPFSGSANGKIGINQPTPLYSFDVSGSGNYTNGLTVTGSIVATSITSSLLGTASYAVNANFLDNLDSTSFVYTSSYNVDSSSFSTRVTNTEATASSLVTASGSFSNRVTIIESSYATTGSNLFSGTQGINSIANAISFTSTASLYTDGGARITKDLYVSGTSYFNNVTIYGTQSVQYITSSQLNIGTNIITVNTDTPTVRYGGLAVYDSGSTGLTGSLLWDSEANHWIYTNPSGSTYSGGMMISGPRASARGCEQGTTSCALMMGQGGDHITSSAILHYGNATCFYGTSFISGSGNACFSGQVCSNTISTTDGTNTSTLANNYLRYNGGDFYVDACAVGGNFRIRTSNTTALDSTALFICGKNSNVGIGTTTPSYKLDVAGDLRTTQTAIIGNGAAQTELQINSLGGNNQGPFIRFQKAGAAKGYIGAYSAIINGTSDDLTYYAICSQQWMTNNSTSIKMLLDGSGNLMVGSADAGNAGTINVSVGVAGTTAGGLQLWATSAQTHYLQFGDGTAGAGPYAGYVGYAHSTDSLLLGAGAATRATISSTGIACFSNTVCAPTAIFTKSSDQIIRVETTSVTDNARIDFITPSKCYTIQNLQTGAANALIFYDLTAASERMRISSAGNVGIGTTSPTRTLSISCSTGPNLELVRTGFSGYTYIEDDGTNSIYRSGGATIVQTGGTTERLRVTSTGIACFACQVCAPNATIANCLGVGVTSPQGNFEAVGLSYFTRTNNSLLINPNYGGANTHTQLQVVCNMALAFATNGDNERMRLDALGNLGLGVSSIIVAGACRRHFQLGYSTCGAIVSLGTNVCESCNPRVFSGQYDLGFASGISTGNMQFYTNDSERLRVTSTGIACFACQVCAASFNAPEVNIGTSLSGYALTVKEKGCTGAPFIAFVGSTSNGSWMRSYWFCSDATTTLAQLTVQPTDNMYFGSLVAMPLILQTNNSSRLTIASTGAACFACELTAKSLGTNDLILNNLNHDHANYVDGTRGSWLIQEGACDLFIINQVSCKKYKFNLIEIK